MEWNEVLNLVENMERLGSYTVIDHNESIKDIIILSSKVNELQREVGELWDVKAVKADYIDVNNNSDYLMSVRIDNRVGDIISYIETIGLGYLDSAKLNYLRENREEFNRFIRVNRLEKSNILKELEQLVSE